MNLPGTNTAAYFTEGSVPSKKSFLALPPALQPVAVPGRGSTAAVWRGSSGRRTSSAETSRVRRRLPARRNLTKNVIKMIFFLTWKISVKYEVLWYLRLYVTTFHNKLERLYLASFYSLLSWRYLKTKNIFNFNSAQHKNISINKSWLMKLVL
jgi:hypothetical protein